MKQSRHQSRFMCVQSLYQGLLTRFDVILETFLKENKIEKVDIAFVTEIYYGVQNKLDELHKKLQDSLKRKKFEYLVTLQKAILYAAAYEYYFKKIDKGILIKEYVLLAKRFFHNDEYKVIHASIHSLAARDSDVKNIDMQGNLNVSAISVDTISDTKINNDDLCDNDLAIDTSNLTQVENDTVESNDSEFIDSEQNAKVAGKNSASFRQQSVSSQQCIIAKENIQSLKHISISCASNDQILL